MLSFNLYLNKLILNFFRNYSLFKSPCCSTPYPFHSLSLPSFSALSPPITPSTHIQSISDRPSKPMLPPLYSTILSIGTSQYFN